MSDEGNGPRFNADYMYVPGGKKKFPLASFVVLVLVVVGFCVGGYFVHKGFGQKTANADSENSLSGAAAVENSESAVKTDNSSVTAPEVSFSDSAAAPTSGSNGQSVADAAGTGLSEAEKNQLVAAQNKINREVISAAAASVDATATNNNDDGSSAVAGNALAPVAADKEISQTGSQVTAVAGNPAAGKISEMSASAQDATVLVRQADAEYAKGDFKNAKELLAQAYGQVEIAPAAGDLKYAILYRLGLVNRQLKEEKAAQAAWVEAYNAAPSTVYGRLSALALADTWYYWYVQSDVRYDQWEKIRDAYSTVIGMDGARFLDRATDKRVGDRLVQLNEKLVFDPKMKTRGAVFHTVRSGEFVSSIARKYNLGNWTSIPQLNKIDPRKLRAGMTLKLMPGRLFILVDKKNFMLSWYLDGTFIKRYPCAIGATETETPVGHYQIFKMDINPTWTDPKTGRLIKYGEPGHLIGSRWMAMRGGSKTGLGIHGTVDPSSMGKKASNGCVRLLKDDVEELYGFASVEPGNESEVLVIE